MSGRATTPCGSGKSTSSAVGRWYIERGDPVRARNGSLSRAPITLIRALGGGRVYKGAIEPGKSEIPVYNLRGGIDAWSQFVDPSVLRY